MTDEEISIFIGKTAEYRVNLDRQLNDLKSSGLRQEVKLDAVIEKLNTLPCPERKKEKEGLVKLWDEKHKNIGYQLAGMWAVIGTTIISGVVLGIWIKQVIAR